MYRRIAASWIAPGLALALISGCEACRKKPPVEAAAEPARRSGMAVEGIDPSWVEEGSSVEVTIAGAEFHAGATVDVGGYRASGARVVDGGTIVATVPGSLPVGGHDVRVTNPDGDSASLRSGFAVRSRQVAECGLETVHFAYDRSDLDDRSRSLLQRVADCIQQRGYAKVQIAGHADERGSTDYNLALGQRRADAVRKYLGGLGIDGSRLATISFGEERPVDTASTEDAWSRNRRAEMQAQR